MSAPETILVVDDDADIREMLGLVLEGDGYAVVTAGDGREALALLDSGLRPSLILLDLMMNGMNGYDFYVEYAKHDSYRSIPVLILTGHTRARDAAEALGVEAMNKPIALDTLLDAVHRLAA